MIRKRFFRWLGRYYDNQLTSLYTLLIPHNATVLRMEADHSTNLDTVSQSPFDCVLISTIAHQQDIQLFLQALKSLCHEKSRIIITTHGSAWRPFFWFTEKIGLRQKPLIEQWICQKEYINLLHLAGFEIVATGQCTLMPIYIPIISTVFNQILAKIPCINRMCLTRWIVAQPAAIKTQSTDYTVSIIIPCRNEAGNIIPAVERIPTMGKSTEIIFVEGNSHDATIASIQQAIAQYPGKKISWHQQDGIGKGDAVRKGFAHATGDILMILDADLTVPPEELPKFFNALAQEKADFINGSRLVYDMESHAMQHLNLCANKFFAALFSWILNRTITDTLCGTKVLWRKDYERLAQNRSYFGDFDPFGDFDLLFGAAKLNLTIINMPIHYKNRTYGSTQIRRFYHGIILLWMSGIGIRKFKFR
ncbi:MAG TPA: glycosyltransferase family 2 protein [Candidatus Babeliales bacterium]|nr:glycosyltransferase family 2 protein [Candidatus Babeliales bacterium]